MLAADFSQWDPLSQTSAVEAELADEMRKQEIRNILRSYTGFFDLFSELIQNALDSVDEKVRLEGSTFNPLVDIHINLQEQSVTVSDNGMGLEKPQLLLFLQPNLSFKKNRKSRGNKGVGATYLAYGFNYLRVVTRTPNFYYSGVLENGRRWAEDTTKSVVKPKMYQVNLEEDPLANTESGASFCIKLVGDKIRPKDLSWIGASTADQWMAILRIKTPLGGLYLFSDAKPRTICRLKVTDASGSITDLSIEECSYLFPHDIPGKFVALSDLVKYQEKVVRQGKPLVWTQEYSRLHGIYDLYLADDVLAGKTPIRPNLNERQQELMKEHKPDIYVFFGYSTSIWDEYNDVILKIRKRERILRGGLQLATQGMVQGELLTIPLTVTIGYQNTTHIVVHFHDADPDLGRKGFQPELVELAERLSVSCVTAFKKWNERMRKDTGQPHISAQAEKYEWIKKQEKHAEDSPLTISGIGLFAPTEALPITSLPLVEQDVIALFHQLLAAGVIRGIRILATSQHQRYDSVCLIENTRTEKFIYDKLSNPLGIPRDAFTEETIKTSPFILEYKYNADALIADLSKDVKFERDIDLVIAWSIGDEWKRRYQVIPYLHDNHLYDRAFHGITHAFLDDRSGEHKFYGIILEELVRYLATLSNGRESFQNELKNKYIEE
jgi:hypothetical protein